MEAEHQPLGFDSYELSDEVYQGAEQLVGFDAVSGDRITVKLACDAILDCLRNHPSGPQAITATVAGAIDDILEACAEQEAHFLTSQLLIRTLKLDLANAKSSIRTLQKQVFGESSERSLDADSDHLFNLSLDEEADEEQTPQQKGRRKSKKPADLPVRNVDHYPPNRTCCGCGCEMPSIGSDTSERIVIIPEQVVIVRDNYHRCACNKARCKENRPVSAKSPHFIMKGRSVGLSLVLEAAIQKFFEHSPNYRFVRRLQQSSLNISRQTVSRNVEWLAGFFKPIADVILAEVLKSEVVQMDETPVQIQNPKNGKKGKTDRGYFWVMCKDESNWNPDARPAVHFAYAPSRSGEVAQNLTAGSNIRFLQTDGYAGYNALFESDGIKEPMTSVRCLAHARRKFVDLPDTGQKGLRSYVIRKFKDVYAVEPDIKGLSAAERATKRQEKSLPILQELQATLERSAPQAEGKMAAAIQYMLKAFTALTRYVYDGRLEIDSNGIERRIRAVALTKKNSLFAGSHDAAASWAIYYSLIETARLNRVNPRAYLTWVAGEIESKRGDVDYTQLMPWHCPNGHIT